METVDTILPVSEEYRSLPCGKDNLMTFESFPLSPSEGHRHHTVIYYVWEFFAPTWCCHVMWSRSDIFS